MDLDQAQHSNTHTLCMRVLNQVQQTLYHCFPCFDSFLFSMIPVSFTMHGKKQSAPPAASSTADPAAPSTAVAKLDAISAPPLNDTAVFGTDDVHIFYEPTVLLSSYYASPEAVTRCYLHLILHNVFLHIMEYRRYCLVHPAHGEIYQLACDILTEYYIDQSALGHDDPAGSFRASFYQSCFSEKVPFSPMTVMDCLLTSQVDVDKLFSVFRLDDHRFWDVPRASLTAATAAADGSGDASGSDSGISQELFLPFHSDCAPSDLLLRKQLQKKFLSALRQKKSKRPGTESGGMVMDAMAKTASIYDYQAFLRRFSSIGEEIELDLDQFDLIYYTYGLGQNKKIPFVEPLEYRDLYKIQELVIAIDTSGSCSGKLVQRFLDETIAILGNKDFFFQRVNLHLVQCDSAIQDHTVITSREEFEAYQSVKLKGFGGTDYRPVFHLVEKLIREKQFTDLRGLIYFTDGQGMFPEQKPAFQTAFVMVDQEDLTLSHLPDWVIPLILPEEIDESVL